MLGTQLGGDFVPNNTITGTEHLNNSGHTGNGYFKNGLQYPEHLAAQYLDDQYNAQCPLYYAVTANYEADELIRTTSNYYSIGGPAQHPYQTDASADGTIIHAMKLHR